MGTIKVEITKTAVVEVDVPEARFYLAKHHLTDEEVAELDDQQVAECYVSWAEGNYLEPEFTRTIAVIE